jgi:hypothetical protein
MLIQNSIKKLITIICLIELIKKMANRYKNIDTTEEQMPQTQPSIKQIRWNPHPNSIKHHVKFYFVQKDHETGKRLSKQILMM